MTNFRGKGLKLIKAVFAASLSVTVLLSGCGSISSYHPNSRSDHTVHMDSELIDMFAEDLCVVNTEIGDDPLLDSSASCGLFDLNRKKVIYAHRVNDRVEPASLTKIMTAIIALKYGESDMKLTATSSVELDDSGAARIGLKPGDSMTLDQALHYMLIASACDVSMLIADGVAGSVEDFVGLMNDEAVRLGATQTNFKNPHGLTEQGHYSTAYDMYLIFNEAMKYPEFTEIIHTANYRSQYMSASGEPVEKEVRNTSKYLSGDVSAPTGMTVIGGKTGTTTAAGSCLIMLARDLTGDPYIAVVMKADNSEDLYNKMGILLSK